MPSTSDIHKHFKDATPEAKRQQEISKKTEELVNSKRFQKNIITTGAMLFMLGEIGLACVANQNGHQEAFAVLLSMIPLATCAGAYVASFFTRPVASVIASVTTAKIEEEQQSEEVTRSLSPLIL